MDRILRQHRTNRSSGTTTRPWALALVTLMLGFAVACEESPTALDSRASVDASAASDAAPPSAAAHGRSHAPFRTWHQGFNHGTEGWYGGETAGGLGWCGTIEHHVGRRDGIAPSAGRGYATVELGSCNAMWTGVFGPALVGAPAAQGPDFALWSEHFPRSGFVMELDVYLDPDWTLGTFDPGTINFFAPPGSIFTLAASVRELASPPNAPVFHYFAVPVLPDGGALSILGRPVTEEGWYTFRFVFTSESGQLSVDFELAERRGGTLFEETLDTRFYSGLPTSGLATAEVGSGYLWFAGVTPGLELSIDEHVVRPGR